MEGCSLFQFHLLTSMLSLCLYPLNITHLLALVCGCIHTHTHSWFICLTVNLFTFRYVSPLISYSNLQLVLCRILIVGWLTWIRSAGGNKTSFFPFFFHPGLTVVNLVKLIDWLSNCMRAMWTQHNANVTEIDHSSRLHEYQWQWVWS